MAPRPELYDLRTDPGETANLLAAEPGVYREIKRQLVEVLQGFAVQRPEIDDADRAAVAAVLLPAGGQIQGRGLRVRSGSGRRPARCRPWISVFWLPKARCS